MVVTSQFLVTIGTDVYICGSNLFLWENSQNPFAGIAKCNILTSECSLIQTEFTVCDVMVITNSEIFVGSNMYINIYQESISQWVAIASSNWDSIGLWKSIGVLLM